VIEKNRAKSSAIEYIREVLLKKNCSETSLQINKYQIEISGHNITVKAEDNVDTTP